MHKMTNKPRDVVPATNNKLQMKWERAEAELQSWNPLIFELSLSLYIHMELT